MTEGLNAKIEVDCFICIHLEVVLTIFYVLQGYGDCKKIVSYYIL